MKERERYQIRVQGKLVEVQKPLYLTYYRMSRREKYLEEKDAFHGVVLYSSLDTEETTGEDMLPDTDSDSLEDVVVSKIMREKLRSAIKQLHHTERELIYALFYEGKTERQVSCSLGIPQKALNDKKRLILCKLLKFLKT